MAGQRLHPFSLLQRFLRSIPAVLLGLLPVLLGRSRADDTILLVFLLLYGFVAVPLIVAQYVRFRYWITAREIVIHSGILTRRKRNIPLERIQNIAIERSLLPRMLGTARVKIETAGSSQAEGVLEYVHLEEARRIRQIVRDFREAPRGLPGTILPLHQEEQPAPDELFALSTRRLLLSGAFRFSLLYIAIAFSGFQILAGATGVTEGDIEGWLYRLGAGEEALAASSARWLAVALLAACAIALGWLCGLLLQVVRYYKFELRLDGARLQLRRGLLTVREGILPLRRLQALIVRTNPILRRFGWFRLELQTIGHDVSQVGNETAVPFARLDETLKVASRIKPFRFPESFRRVSRRTIRRTSVRYYLVWLLLFAGAAFLWQPAVWGLCAAPLLSWFAVLQYRKHGYALSERYLFIKRGVFRQRTWIIPVERFQVFNRQGTLFQRRLGLRTLVVDTAGALPLSSPKVVDLPAEEAVYLMDQLYSVFRDRTSREAKATRVKRVDT